MLNHRSILLHAVAAGAGAAVLQLLRCPLRRLLPEQRRGGGPVGMSHRFQRRLDPFEFCSPARRCLSEVVRKWLQHETVPDRAMLRTVD